MDTPTTTPRATFNAAEAARLLGVGRATLYRLADDEVAAGRALRVGARIVWPRRPLLAALDLTDEEAAAILAA